MSFKLFKKAASLLTLIAFLSTNVIYAAPDKLRVPVGQAVTLQRIKDVMAVDTSNEVTRLADALEEEAIKLVVTLEREIRHGQYDPKKLATKDLEEKFIKRIVKLDGIKEKIPALIEIAQSNRSPIVRAAFIRALGEIGAKEAREDLLGMLRNEPENSIIIRPALTKALSGVGRLMESPHKSMGQGIDYALSDKVPLKDTVSSNARQMSEQVFGLWRRSFDVLPPPDANGFSESLKIVSERVVPYYREEIQPLIMQEKKNVMVSAHGNSLRALSMELFKLTPQEVQDFTFPLATPMRVRFSNNGAVSSVQIVESSERNSPDPKNVKALTALLEKKGISYTIVQLPGTSDALSKDIIMPSAMDVGELFLIRHGETVSSDTLPGGGYFAGWLDVELTEKGRLDAMAAGKALHNLLDFTKAKIDVAFTSDLRRAKDTLTGTMEGMGNKVKWIAQDELKKNLKSARTNNEMLAVSDSHLKERNYGALQGEKRIEFMEKLDKAIQKLWDESSDLVGADAHTIAQKLSANWQELTAQDAYIRETLMMAEGSEQVRTDQDGTSKRQEDYALSDTSSTTMKERFASIIPQKIEGFIKRLNVLKSKPIVSTSDITTDDINEVNGSSHDLTSPIDSDIHYIGGEDASKYTEEAESMVLNGNIVSQKVFGGDATRLKMTGSKFLFNGFNVLNNRLENFQDPDVRKAVKEMQELYKENGILNISLGARAIIQERLELERLAKKYGRDPKEALKNYKFIVQISDKSDDIIEEFKHAGFFGFSRENVIFTAQDTFTGYAVKDGEVVPYEDQSLKFAQGNAYTFMQAKEPGVAFYIDKDGKKVYLKNISALQYFEDKGASLVSDCQVEDLDKLNPRVIDIERIALALKLMKEEKFNVVADGITNEKKEPCTVTGIFDEKEKRVVGIKNNISGLAITIEDAVIDGNKIKGIVREKKDAWAFEGDIMSGEGQQIEITGNIIRSQKGGFFVYDKTLGRSMWYEGYALKSKKHADLKSQVLAKGEHLWSIAALLENLPPNEEVPVVLGIKEDPNTKQPLLVLDKARIELTQLAGMNSACMLRKGVPIRSLKTPADIAETFKTFSEQDKDIGFVDLAERIYGARIHGDGPVTLRKALEIINKFLQSETFRSARSNGMDALISKHFDIPKDVWGGKFLDETSTNPYPFRDFIIKQLSEGNREVKAFYNNGKLVFRRSSFYSKSSVSLGEALVVLSNLIKNLKGKASLEITPLVYEYIGSIPENVWTGALSSEEDIIHFRNYVKLQAYLAREGHEKIAAFYDKNGKLIFRKLNQMFMMADNERMGSLGVLADKLAVLEKEQDMEEVISGLAQLNKELNNMVITKENRRDYDAIMVKKSQLARDIAGKYMNEGKDVSRIIQMALTGMEDFIKYKVAKKDMEEAKGAQRLVAAKRYIEEWMDPKNDIPDHIKQGFIRGTLEGRYADILYAFGFGWREFGTAGIRNEAVQSSYDAIKMSELEEFAKDPHAPILTGPNLINSVVLLQQVAAAVRYIRYLQKNIDDPALGLSEKAKGNLKNNKIAIAYDSRLNGIYFAHMLASAFLKEDIKVDLFDNPAGVPALAIAAGHYGSIDGFLISASHSEAWFNGFKFFDGATMSQIDAQGKKMIMEQRAEVTYKDMNLDLASQSLSDFDVIFTEHKDSLTWFGQKDPVTGRNYCGANRVSFYDYYYEYVKNRSPLAVLSENIKQRIEDAKKKFKVLYTAFFGVGAVPAANVPGFLRNVGYKDVDIVEAQTAKMDGRFPGHVMPDPGVVEGWVANFLDYLKQYAGEDLSDIDNAIDHMNERELSGAGDPDVDRAGMVLSLKEGVAGNIKERLIEAVIKYIKETDNIHEAKKETVIANVSQALKDRMNDKLLLTANEAWEFTGFYKLKILEENNALSKDKLYIILKSHVTTSGLHNVAEYYKAKGYNVYVVDTYVGFTELAKKWRDLCIIAGAAWGIYKTDPQNIAAIKEKLDKLENAYSVFKQNVPFDTRGLTIIDKTIKLSTEFIGSNGKDNEKLELAKNNLNLIAHMVDVMGVEESNGYGEMGNYNPETGQVENAHISDKDGGLALYEFSELLAYGKAILGKDAYEMFTDMIKEIGYTATYNSFLLHQGLTGVDEKLDEIVGIEKIFSVLLQKMLDEGKEVKLFNGRYTLEDIVIYRDGKYDNNLLGFPEEGISLILRTANGNRAIATYRPSGTGTSNRDYNWILGVKPSEGTDIENYRQVIVHELGQMVKDFFGTEGQDKGYVDLSPDKFSGLLSALKEGGKTRQMEIFGKALGIEIGFSEAEKPLYETSMLYTYTMRKQDFKHMNPDKVQSELKQIREVDLQNINAWKTYLDSSEAKNYPKKLKFSVDGKVVAEIPAHLVKGWQPSLVGYLAGLVLENGSDVSKISSDSDEIIERIKETLKTKKELQKMDNDAEKLAFTPSISIKGMDITPYSLEELREILRNPDAINSIWRLVYTKMTTPDEKIVSLTKQVIGKFSINELQRIPAIERRIKKQLGENKMKEKFEDEKRGTQVIAEKLQDTVLDAKGDTTKAASFLKGGYGQDGYGVPEGAAIHGSFALVGNQGYYAKDSNGREAGKEAFISTVNSMREFFQRRRERLGEPIKYVIKTGIGGQHTPFQGISDVFQVINAETGKISGEYELGKDFEATMTKVLKDLGIDWDQVAVIPSSKSGSTDETMMVFVEIFNTMLKHQAIKEGIDGDRFADIVLKTLHEVNFIYGKERAGKDLFRVDMDRFGTDNLITLISENAKDLGISRDKIKGIFAKVLGNMFFETTDRVDQSRLSAFIHNSGLDTELGEDAPGFGAMFDNVGGRWTGDLHMMTFLAYHGLDAEKYWEVRRQGIAMFKKGKHIANVIGNKILDEGITDIALLVPDEFFWFGKSNEQNFNESIWQEGSANLVTVRQSQWDSQKDHYANNPKRLVINLSSASIPEDSFNIFKNMPDIRAFDNQALVNTFGELFTTFYGITTVVGDRLIARALKEAGYKAEDVDLNDLNNPATRIVQANLYVRQPYVELGKGLLETELKALQEKEKTEPGAIEAKLNNIKQMARNGNIETNIDGLDITSNITDLNELKDAITKASEFAEANGRKFVPFVYLEGDKFYDLRDYLIFQGIEWVMQGTGDQHISYQQVLAQPKKYLPFVISFVPENTLPGRPAIGFAKGYLDNVSPNMVRDLFANASYRALTELRKDQGGLGLFLRMTDSEDNINMLKRAAAKSEGFLNIDKKVIRDMNGSV